MTAQPARQAERWHDYRKFVKWHVGSGDIDPVYPVLRAIAPEVCADGDERDSLIMLYVAYYDLGSALRVWLDGWRPGKELSDVELHYPTGTERRAHRSVRKLAEHITALGVAHRCGSWKEALRAYNPDNSAGDDWRAVQDRLRAIHGNGRWAAYKTGELLVTVADWPIEPTDAGHDFSTGPRKGLADLWPHLADLQGATPGVVARLNAYTDHLVRALDLPVEQVETTLCDWHSMLKGRYYVGHDIDVMLGQLYRVDDDVDITSLVLDARRKAFDECWLGEVGGWTGVRGELRTLYRDDGIIRWWAR